MSFILFIWWDRSHIYEHYDDFLVVLAAVYLSVALLNRLHNLLVMTTTK